jgi:hypothetical protein
VALIDHFMECGKIQSDYIQQQFNMWSEFIAYFGSLAWDEPEADLAQSRRNKRAKRKGGDDEFELIDDDGKQVVNRETEFELVGANNRTTGVVLTESIRSNKSAVNQVQVRG